MSYERTPYTDDEMRGLVDQLTRLEAESTSPNFDDFVLSSNIDELVNGTQHRDSFRLSKSELATSLLKTITLQFSSGSPSPEAIRYVSDRFSAYFDSTADIDSLDAAFFLKSNNLRGGQAKDEADELEVCQA